MGSATTVVSINVRLQNIRVAVNHHAPTIACHTNRRHQDKISNKRKSRKASFNLYKVVLIIYKVLLLESLSVVKVPIVSHCLARDKQTGRKLMKMRKEKTEEL